MKLINAKKAFLGAVLILFTAFAQSAELTGKVIKVVDGDTIHLLDTDKVTLKIRLAGIDAPEKKMPFGERSRQLLAELVAGKTVLIKSSKSDRYKRLIGVVYLGETDINLEMIRAGMAWHYKKYEREQTASERLSYSKAEVGAKMGKLGLWRDPQPIAPWDWRKGTAQSPLEFGLVSKH